MQREDDLLMNEVINEMRSIVCPHKIDVTDSVMQAIEHKALLSPRIKNKHTVWKTIISASVACLLVAVVVNVSISIAHDRNEPAIGNMFAYVLDYTIEYGSNTSAMNENMETVNLLMAE